MQNRWNQILWVLSLLASCAAAPAARPAPAPATGQPAPARQATRSAPPGTRLVPWYEFLLRPLNRDNFDYGARWEERREALVDASLRNPYFRYSAAVTLALFLLAMLYAKHRIDHRRTMWITAEMMADVYKHDEYSRQIAREAIARYNEHIERCNRAIENGLPAPGADAEVGRFRSDLVAVASERDSFRRERDLLKNELADKERLLADLSLRIDALAKKSDARHAASASDLRGADAKLVQHIKRLQEELYAEKRENQRLKGG